MVNGPVGLLHGLGSVKYHNMVHFLIQIYCKCSYLLWGLGKVNYCSMVHFLISSMALEGVIIEIWCIF